MKIIYLLFLLSLAISNGQNIKTELNKFDSLNGAQNKEAKKVLLQLQKSKIYKQDSIKALVYNSFIRYHLSTESDIDKVNTYCDSCVQYASKAKKLYIASSCLHNQAVAYHYKNDIETAITIERKALEYAKLAKDDKNYFISLIAIARRYYFLAKYKESNDLLINEIDKIKDEETKAVALLILASNYRSLGSKVKLDTYYLTAISNFKKNYNQRLLGSAILEYCNYLVDNEKFNDVNNYADSLLYYSKTHYSKTTAMYLKSRAFYGLKNYDKSLSFINQAIKLDTDVYNAYNLIDDYKDRGKIYLEINRLDDAIKDFETSKKLFSEAKDETLFVEVLKYNILAKLKRNDEPLSKEFDLFVKLKDSIYDAQTTESLTKFETQYRTAEKEAKIKTQQLQLQKEKANRNLALGGLGLLLLLSGAGYLFFKNKQKTAALQTQNTLLNLQQNLIESELHSLNKQLDPHEIKNLLASISPEIQEKAPESYKKMLKLFNLTKASLNSKTITDTIENQVQQIEDFLSLEKSMLTMPLAYTIQNNIENSQMLMPRLLLKNLVENAIKHGIKLKENGGEIVVKLEQINNFINVTVDDTGRGRLNAISLDSGIGTSTYQKLFATLNPKNADNATFEIIDKEQGTKVEVKIPIDYKYS